jgi:hypothetical protein
MTAPKHMGKVDGMPFAEYLAIEAASKSLLSDLAVSPYTACAHHINPQRPKREPTAAMKAGTLAHTLILEPDTVAARYVVRPEGMDARTKAGKEWAEAQPAGVEVITAEQMDTAKQQAESVRRVAGHWLKKGIAERSIFWADKATGAYCKARPDWVTRYQGDVLMLDLKTAADVSPDGFSKAIAKLGYHRQAAHYIDGYEAATGVLVAEFILLAVENAYPWQCVPYVLDAFALRQGCIEVNKLLTTYAECQRTGQWPGFGPGLQLISLPDWALGSELEE